LTVRRQHLGADRNDLCVHSKQCMAGAPLGSISCRLYGLANLAKLFNSAVFVSAARPWEASAKVHNTSLEGALRPNALG
jgi:hypothetical protein